MVKVPKSAGGGAPVLDILAAKLRVVEAELTLEEKTITPDNGQSFVAEPNLSLKLEVVKNLVNPGVDEGVMFYDRFKLKKVDGVWQFVEYSKLGKLIALRYGAEWFENPDAEVDEKDFLDYEFVAAVEQKTDRKGTPLTGSTIPWKTMRPAGGADEAEAEAKAAGTGVEEVEEQIESDLSAAEEAQMNASIPSEGFVEGEEEPTPAENDAA